MRFSFNVAGAVRSSTKEFSSVLNAASTKTFYVRALRHSNRAKAAPEYFPLSTFMKSSKWLPIALGASVFFVCRGRVRATCGAANWNRTRS
jgi:hypothetical protein